MPKDEDIPPPVEWTDLLPEREELPPGHHPRLVRLVAWHLRNALVTSEAFKKSGYKTYLGEPECQKQIPIKKTDQMPARAMDIKQSTSDGQTDILNEMLKTHAVTLATIRKYTRIYKKMNLQDPR